jgi:hypothetical protein
VGCSTEARLSARDENGSRASGSGFDSIGVEAAGANFAIAARRLWRTSSSSSVIASEDDSSPVELAEGVQSFPPSSITGSSDVALIGGFPETDDSTTAFL